MTSDSKPSFTKGRWSVGVYETTETMIARLKAKPQSCVCLVEPDGSPGMVIALCGDADDIQSQADADVIAVAPEMYSLIKDLFNSAIHPEAFEVLQKQAEKILAKVRGES